MSETMRFFAVIVAVSCLACASCVSRPSTAVSADAADAFRDALIAAENATLRYDYDAAYEHLRRATDVGPAGAGWLISMWYRTIEQLEDTHRRLVELRVERDRLAAELTDKRPALSWNRLDTGPRGANEPTPEMTNLPLEEREP